MLCSNGILIQQSKETEIKAIIIISQGFPGGSVVKNLPANAGGTGDAGSIPRSGRSLRGGNGNPLQYSCLENPINRGAWHATVHGVTKSHTQLSTHIQHLKI